MVFKKIKLTYILLIPFLLFLEINNAKSQVHNNIESYFDIPIDAPIRASYFQSGYLWGLWAYCAPESEYVYGNKYADLYYFLPHFNGPTFEEFAKGSINFEKTDSWLHGTSGCNEQSIIIAETNLDEFIKNLFFDLGMPDDQILLDDIENLRIKLSKNRHNDVNEFTWYVQRFINTEASIRADKNELAKKSEKLELKKIDSEKKAEEEKIQNEKKLVSDTIIKNNSGLIQSALKSLGFYKGPIDNDFGKASLLAMAKWKASNKLKENSIISQEEFDLLKEQALANKSDNSKPINETQESENTEKEDIKQLNKELIFAKQFIEDLINFQKINPDSIDVIRLSNLIISNKDILNNAWNEIIKNDFEKLKRFVIKNDGFNIYRLEQEKIRKKEELNLITNIKLKLEKNDQFLESYLRNNITSDFAPDILSYIKKVKKIRSVEDINLINDFISELEDFYKKNNIYNDYLALEIELPDTNKIKIDKEINKKENLDNINAFNQELEYAKIYISDLINFQKMNSNSIDIIELSKLISSNKYILKNEWNEIIKSDFEKLRKFVDKNSEFANYRDELDKSRKKKELNFIASTNSTLDKNDKFLENFLRENITSELVPKILSYIESLKEIKTTQNINIINDFIFELEDFYKKNKIYEDYLVFENQKISDPNEIIAQEISDISLIEFNFIKESSNDDFISLVNLSGSSPNALINLEGDIVFENDTALSCFYQSRKIDKKKKFYIIDNISDKKFIIKVLDDECDRSNLLKYDILIFKKDDLIKETKSYVSSLVSEVGNSNYREFKIISEKKFEEELVRRDIISKQTKDDIINQTKMGFGALVIGNNSTALCSDLITNQKGHKSIINLLDNEFQRMAYDKSISEVNFDDIEQTFTNIQRGKCGFVYSSETSLSKILNGLNNTNTNYEVLPIWYSENEVLAEQERIESTENAKIVEIQKTKEEIEKQKELEKNRLESEGITKKQEQEELQAKSANVVNYFIEIIEKEAEKLFDIETIKDSWLSEEYPEMRQFIEDRLKESWELNEISATINDYGLADFRNRRIETFIFDINSRIMNRDIGEYQDNCFRLGVILDAEFDRKREPEITNCTEESMDFYKKRINFSSEWLVQ